MKDTIKRSADSWFARLQSDTHSKQDERQHQQWLDANPTHKKAFRDTRALWNQAGEFADQPELLVMRKEALQSFRSDNRVKPRLWFSARLWAPLALAACFAVVVFNSNLLTTLLQPGDIHETRIGEQRQLALDDGTTLLLDTQTRLAVHYSKSRRLVVLEQGQAQFNVAKDSSRPFVVEAGNGEITALGTAFVINKDRDTVVVTLLEGSVAVVQETPSPASQPAVVPDDAHNRAGASQAPVLNLQLTPGQQVAYSSQAGISLASTANIEQVTAWQQGRLIFEDDTLNDVLSELNRYSSAKILFGDDSLQQIKITGVFKTGDHGKAIKALQAYFPMRVIEDRNGNYILLRGK